jgi:hypothetical protein
MDITHHPVFYIKQRSADWVLSPSSGKNLLSWAQLIELVPISRPEDEDRIQSPKHCVLNKKQDNG